jgi:hypothetical protein
LEIGKIFISLISQIICVARVILVWRLNILRLDYEASRRTNFFQSIAALNIMGTYGVGKKLSDRVIDSIIF